MRLNDIFDLNVVRCNRWHGVDDWTPLEWAGAMAGEAGEAANAAKKLKRLENSIASINDEGRHFESLDEARMQISEEVADTILYGLLLMARVGVLDPESILVNKFNRTSEKYGFPERLQP